MPRKSNLKEYLNKIQEYYNKTGIIPNFEILTQLLGLKSKGSIHKIFTKLVEMGYLLQEGKKFFPTEKFTSIPMFESVKAGIPDEATDEHRNNVNIQSMLVENPTNSVMIKVKGNSMIDAGINDGDVVIVDKKQKAAYGEIVVAIVDGEYTLKYLMKDQNGKTYLQAANIDYSDIYPENNLEIFGKVIGSFRKY